MKKTIIALLVLVSSITCFSQTKETSKDSLKADTKFLSINDMYKYAEPLKDKVTAKQFEIYSMILNEVINQAVADYYKKSGQPKK